MKHNQILKSYIIGFIISLTLTLLAYFIAQIHPLSHHQLITYLLIGLAILQLLVQLLFFLHLGQESKPHWNLLFFLSTVSIILILVVGAIWIMDHLNHSMTPGGMESAIIHEEGIHKTGY